MYVPALLRAVESTKYSCMYTAREYERAREVFTLLCRCSRANESVCVGLPHTGMCAPQHVCKSRLSVRALTRAQEPTGVYIACTCLNTCMTANANVCTCTCQDTCSKANKKCTRNDDCKRFRGEAYFSIPPLNAPCRRWTGRTFGAEPARKME